MGKSRNLSGKADKDKVDGNNWLPVPREFLASRACANLSPLASKLLIALLAQLGRNAYGNGRSDLHPNRLRALGWTSTASARAALRELIEANIVLVTRQGRKGCIGLYAVTIWPMECKHEDLDVRPGAWTKDCWREAAGAAEKPTPERPAKWAKPRQRKPAERHISTTRSGNASGVCVPATGMNPAETGPCVPAAGVHSGVLARNAFPQRDSLSRLPSAGAASKGASTETRMAAVIRLRTRGYPNPNRRAVLAARGIN